MQDGIDGMREGADTFNELANVDQRLNDRLDDTK